jgi:osmoprotectant transport system permease protein
VSDTGSMTEAMAAATEPGRATGRPRERGVLSLVITPVILAALALLLMAYVNGAEKDISETSALRWDVRLYPQLRGHIDLTLWSTLWVLLIALPLGAFLTRPRFRWLGGPLLAVANSGQAVPAYGLLVLLMTWLGTGPRTAIIALVTYTILPVLRNTMVGLDQVDRSVIEAGRGMGLTKLQALTRIELPLAVPVILAGVRTALVINVGTATLAFLIGGGGLGITIFSGIQLNRNLVLFTGAAMTALLALTVDWVAAVVERVLRPKGL